MTAPVLASEDPLTTTMTFSMPKKYTLTTLPKALDSSISFSEIPSKKFAVYRFGWYRTDVRVRTKKIEFMELLKKENVKTIGEPIYAGYNGPGTIPFLVKNEILVEIQ